MDFLTQSTNVQRIVSGVVNYTARNDEGTFNVKYTGATNYEVTLHVLDTDYDSFAVVWSCNSLAGPVGHTGNRPKTFIGLRNE